MAGQGASGRHLRPAADRGPRPGPGCDQRDLADGVLSLTIPVAEEAKPRHIEVQTPTAPTAIEPATT